MLTCGCEDCVGVCPEAGGDEHGVDGEWEHDVGGGQGDDEHVRGHELPPPEHQHQDDQQVEDAAHQHWGLCRHLNSYSSSKVSIPMRLVC